MIKLLSTLTMKQKKSNEFQNDWYRHLRLKAKLASRKYLGTDFNLDGVVIEKDTTDQVKLLFHEAVNVIFDIGANLGQTTLKYRKIFPETIIYAFEPFAEVYKDYQKTFSWDRKIKPYNFAISDKNGKGKFFLNKSHYTNSLLEPEIELNHSFHKVERSEDITVETITLDTFVKKENISQINILKVDVQGGEMKVLEGAKRLIEEQKIDLMFVEVEFISLYRGQPLFYDICRYLEDRKYSFFNFYNIGHTTIGQAIAGDAIFISPKIRKNIMSI